MTLVLALVRNLRTCSVVPREKAQADDPRGRKYRNTEQGRTASVVAMKRVMPVERRGRAIRVVNDLVNR